MDNEDPLRLWQHIHGATTHFPIALVFISVAFDLGTLFFRKKNWRTVGFWTLIAAVILLVPSIASGLFGIYLDKGGKETFAAGGYNAVRTIQWHRNMGFFAAGFLVIPAIWRSVKRDDIAGTAYIVCIIFAAIAAGFIAVTGFNGAYVPRGY